MKNVSKLVVEDRVSITGFKNHNSTVVSVEEKDTCFKVVVERDSMTESEYEDAPDKLNTIFTPKNRLFAGEVVL